LIEGKEQNIRLSIVEYFMDEAESHAIFEDRPGFLVKPLPSVDRAIREGPEK